MAGYHNRRNLQRSATPPGTWQHVNNNIKWTKNGNSLITKSTPKKKKVVPFNFKMYRSFNDIQECQICFYLVRTFPFFPFLHCYFINYEVIGKHVVILIYTKSCRSNAWPISTNSRYCVFTGQIVVCIDGGRLTGILKC